MKLALRIAVVAPVALVVGVMASDSPTANAETLLLTLDTPNPGSYGLFGQSVALGDVNGDGKADIAMGAPWEEVGGNEYQGRAYVFSGADGSLLHTLDSPNPQVEGMFGMAVALGDVNGDDKADIAVAHWNEDVGGIAEQGRLYVFSGADGSILYTLDTPNPQPDVHFGFGVALGDVNDDGKADIAAGAHREDAGGNSWQGRAYVFSGADGSLLHTLDNPNPQERTFFGYNLAVGDVNGDGQGDIAVTAHLQDVGGNASQGRVYVFSGADGSLLLSVDSPDPQENLWLGASLALGKVDGDGRADIAVGAAYKNVGCPLCRWQGRAYVFSGIDGSLLYTLDTPNPQEDCRFGDAVALGDVNSDGKADIAVGAPKEEVDSMIQQGQAYVFSGADGSLLITLEAPNPGDPDNLVPPVDLYFGDAVAVGEVNGDGYGDIAVGASFAWPGGGSAPGRVYVFSSETPLEIDIKPGGEPNSINPESRGNIPVAILSSSDFNAPTQVDTASLTFGATGDEDSLAFCSGAEDVDGDGMLDLVCHFNTQDTGFQCGDTEGIIRGQTVTGLPIEGRDSVRIIPCR